MGNGGCLRMGVEIKMSLFCTIDESQKERVLEVAKAGVLRRDGLLFAWVEGEGSRMVLELTNNPLTPYDNDLLILRSSQISMVLREFFVIQVIEAMQDRT